MKTFYLWILYLLTISVTLGQVWEAKSYTESIEFFKTLICYFGSILKSHIITTWMFIQNKCQILEKCYQIWFHRRSMHTENNPFFVLDCWLWGKNFTSYVSFVLHIRLFLINTSNPRHVYFNLFNSLSQMRDSQLKIRKFLVSEITR